MLQTLEVVGVWILTVGVTSWRGWRLDNLDTLPDIQPRSWTQSRQEIKFRFSQFPVFTEGWRDDDVLRSGDEVELPAHLLGPGHAVDHDVGEAVPPPPPASEAAAVESDAVIPVQRLLRILALNTNKLDTEKWQTHRLQVYNRQYKIEWSGQAWKVSHVRTHNRIIVRLVVRWNLGPLPRCESPAWWQADMGQGTSRSAKHGHTHYRGINPT